MMQGILATVIAASIFVVVILAIRAVFEGISYPLAAGLASVVAPLGLAVITVVIGATPSHSNAIADLIGTATAGFAILLGASSLLWGISKLFIRLADRLMVAGMAGASEMRVHPAIAAIAAAVLGAVGLVMIVLIVGGGGTQSAARPTDGMPSEQSDLIRVVSDARAKYKSAANDMAKGAMRVERKRRLCSDIQSLSAQDWKGTIARLSSNNDGRGVLEIEIGPQIYVHTWNNALSDYGDHTLIDPASSLYSTALKMSVGSNVRFSGSFFTSDEDCLKDTSLTMNGSMIEPEFLFRFDDIDIPK